MFVGVGLSATGVGAVAGVPLIMAGAFTACGGAVTAPAAIIVGSKLKSIAKGYPSKITPASQGSSDDDCKGVGYEKI